MAETKIRLPLLQRQADLQKIALTERLAGEPR